MALVEFEKWLDDKIDFFKRKGTVIFGNEDQEGGSSDFDDYGEFEMAQEEQNHHRRIENHEDFSLSEPEYEFDDSDLKSSEYYRFTFNELEDDDEDDIFDRASHVSLPKSGVQDDVASYQGDIDQDWEEFSDDPEVRNSYDAVKLAQQGTAQLQSLDYADNKTGQPTHYRDESFRFEGDGESFPGSLTELALRDQANESHDADFSLAQVSDDNGDSRYHRKSLKHGSSKVSSPVATLPMDSTYLSMDESNDEDMLEIVRFDDDDGFQDTPDTRPIMVEEQTLRAMMEKRRKLLKKFTIGAVVLIALALVAVVIFLIWKLAGKH